MPIVVGTHYKAGIALEGPEGPSVPQVRTIRIQADNIHASRSSLRGRAGVNILSKKNQALLAHRVSSLLLFLIHPYSLLI
jgi:hypothetical protein